MNDIIVGLDIGTSFIRCVIGQVDEDEHLSIIGESQIPSPGLVEGNIVNLNAMADAIRSAVEESENCAGLGVRGVFTAVGGKQAEGRASTGGVAIDPTGNNQCVEITEEAKDRVQEVARAVIHSMGKELLQSIPQEYRVDGNPVGKNPIDIMGVRLDISVYLISVTKSTLVNIENCLDRSHLVLNGLYLKTLMAALATMREEEMELGSILIDIGTESTDALVIYKGAPIYMTTIPYGGNSVTSDITIVKNLPKNEAERIKLEYGCCMIDEEEADEEILIPEIGARSAEIITKGELCDIIQPRVEEIMLDVRREIVRHAGLKELSGSIVLTGGGAMMPGMQELTQEVWKTESVRLGQSPDYGRVEDDDGYLYRRPDFATALGLVVGNVSRHNAEKGRRVNRREKFDSGSSILEKMKNIWNKFF
ncbi:MAG: cell division protein FtsA [Treponema sp.]|nr:cell division protein FtsA [Treponema sp.]